MRTKLLLPTLLFLSFSVLGQNPTITWLGNGSGIVIDPKGIIATNYHVVKDAAILEVDFGKGENKRSYRCEVIEVDKKNDLALIKIVDKAFNGFGALPYNLKSMAAKTGETVFALGYPKALDILGTEVKYVKGDVSAQSAGDGDLTWYTLSLPIQPGNSGGPLFDFEGNLIGIINAKIVRNDVDNVSFAIKALYLRNLAELSSYSVSVPSGRTLAGKAVTEQIEILTNYVGLIKVGAENVSTAGLPRPPDSPLSRPAPQVDEKVTFNDVEQSFKSNLFDETIRKGTIFLKTDPDNAKVNMYMGYALLSKSDIDNSVFFLERAALQGEIVSFSLKTVRIRGILRLFFVNFGEIYVSKSGLAIREDGKIFSIPLAGLTQLRLDNYQNQCPIVYLEGQFVENRADSEKKKQELKGFNLFPMSTSLQATMQNNVAVNVIVCRDQGIVTTAVLKLLNKLKINVMNTTP